MNETTPLCHDELIARARAGDTSAVGKLLDSYRNYLALMARVQIGNRLQARADASDVVQDTLFAACTRFTQFRGDSEAELVAWLRRILASKVADLVRRHTASQRDIRLEQQVERHLHRSSQDLAQLVPAETGSPSRIVARREQVVLLADALHELPSDYREVLILRHLEGMPFAEVAKRMDRTLDAVKSLWTRALAKLRRSLNASAVS